MIYIWTRIDKGSEDLKKWQNKLSGDQIRVQRFETGTWDIFLNGRLLENYDTEKEAIKRGEEVMKN